MMERWSAVVLAFLGIAVLVLAPPDSTIAAPSCFGDQIKHAQAARIARNTVFISNVYADGTMISAGTGFVVRGAHGMRVVTARHVVEVQPDRDGSLLMTFFSDGVPIGEPRIVASGEVRHKSVSEVDLSVDDLAILAISDFRDQDVKERYEGLDGLPVRIGGPLMVGETNGATGVSWGYSGAPAVDREGYVVGVLTSADFRGRRTALVSMIQAPEVNGQLQKTSVTFPDRSLVVVEPLHGITLVKELASTETRYDQTSSVVLSGFPLANCASTSARLEIADSGAGAALLTKWKSMDQRDAWFLQPQYAIKKVRFSSR